MLIGFNIFLRLYKNEVRKKKKRFGREKVKIGTSRMNFIQLVIGKIHAKVLSINVPFNRISVNDVMSYRHCEIASNLRN